MTFNSRVFCIIPRASAGAGRGETTCTQSCQLSQSTEIKGCVWDLGPAQPWLAGASIPFLYPIPLKAENGDRQFQWLCGEEKGPRVGSGGGASPPSQQSAKKVLFSLHLGLGKGCIKDVMPLAISRFPAALSKHPVPGPHITHTHARGHLFASDLFLTLRGGTICLQEPGGVGEQHYQGSPHARWDASW